MIKPGHVETRAAAIASSLTSGEWMRARRHPLSILTGGLRLELKRLPKPLTARFVKEVVTTIALNEVFESTFSEERRILDLQEMAASAQQFLETCKRTSVFFHSNLLNYGLTSVEAADSRDAQISDTEDLRYARKKAFAAVRLYRLGLKTALDTARRRRRGEKRVADESGLFRKIACLYRDVLLERPASTPGGTFSNIVMRIRAYQCRKTLNDVKNVERIVRAALKNI